MIDSYLFSQFDYVVIQLGENISDYFILDTDFPELVRYTDETQCKDGTPAWLFFVGNFWAADEVDAIKKETRNNVRSKMGNLVA